MNKELIKQECRRYEKWIDRTEAALADAPGGSLTIRRVKGRIRYFHKTSDGREIYLTKEEDALVHALAQKSYNRKLLRFLKTSHRAMQCFLKTCPDGSIEEILGGLSEQRRMLVVPLYPTREQFAAEWLARPYTPKGFRPDDTTAFYTQKGLRVRSKSEILIADMLDSYGIPYKYECPLKLGGIIIHPDFTILDVNRRCEVYLEHGGMLGNEGYASDLIRRIAIYEANGIYLDTRLILTLESAEQPLNTRNLQALLRRRFCSP